MVLRRASQPGRQPGDGVLEGGLVRTLEPQGLGVFRCPPSLLQVRGLQVGPWEREGGDDVRVHGLGQGERLVPLLQKVLQLVEIGELRPLHFGGPGGKVFQAVQGVGVGEAGCASGVGDQGSVLCRRGLAEGEDGRVG